MVPTELLGLGPCLWGPRRCQSPLSVRPLLLSQKPAVSTSQLSDNSLLTLIRAHTHTRVAAMSLALQGIRSLLPHQGNSLLHPDRRPLLLEAGLRLFEPPTEAHSSYPSLRDACPSTI